MQEREYIVFCDESDKKGKFYGNFYGGVLVGSSQYQRITDRLNAVKDELNLFNEVKWQRVSEQYRPKYEQLIKVFFDEIVCGHLKARIMFTRNALIPPTLTKEQIEEEYYRLYYQFIKHAFGLRYMPNSEYGNRLRLYFDTFPDTGRKVETFKEYILKLQHSEGFRNAGITIAEDSVTEVLSHHHVLLQCLDVVLGAMAFRMNDKHKEKPAGQRVRGKRTRAKEALYKFVLQQIRQMHPHFNIGITTGVANFPTGRWESPYLHWEFSPKGATVDNTLTKGYAKKAVTPCCLHQ